MLRKLPVNSFTVVSAVASACDAAALASATTFSSAGDASMPAICGCLRVCVCVPTVSACQSGGVSCRVTYQRQDDGHEQESHFELKMLSTNDWNWLCDAVTARRPGFYTAFAGRTVSGAFDLLIVAVFGQLPPVWIRRVLRVIRRPCVNRRRCGSPRWFTSMCACMCV